MFKDTELEKLYLELSKLNNKPKEKSPVFSFEENDLNVLFNQAPKKTSITKTVEPKTTKVDKDFVLDISSKRHSKADQDLTLGEYLQKYNKVETVIQNEQKSRLKYENSDIEKLINLIDENESQPVHVPFSSKTKNSKDLFISKRVDQSIEVEQDRREKTASVHKALFIGDKINNKKVFTNQAKEDRKPVSQRIENYANAKATITSEKFMSPLALQRYNSKS